jgi:hypothetical protein
MESPVKQKELLSQMKAGWDEVQAFINSLSNEQLTVNTDASGWTVKDHLMHLAVWQDGIEALLRKESRHKTMGLTDALWEDGEVDEINGYLKELHVTKPMDEIRRLADESYQRLVATIGALSEEELNAPYSHFDATVDRDNPVMGWVIGNTFEHYEEHLPWMKAIAEKSA